MSATPSTLDPYCAAMARQVMARVGADPDTAIPLAWWAQSARQARARTSGVVVTESGRIVATTHRTPGTTGGHYLDEPVDGYGQVGIALGRLEKLHGERVLHVRYGEVCEGQAPRPELIDAAACAQMLGVAARTWHAYAARGDAGCPGPVSRIGRSPVWDAAAVMAWHASRPSQRPAEVEPVDDPAPS